MKKIAVTGGIACGKSSLCRFLSELGAYVLSADEIVHQLLSFDADVQAAVVQLIGDSVVVDGRISRQAIADKVFQNQELLRALEAIIHPVVREEIARQYRQKQQGNETPLFVVEIPLLFETHMEDDYDTTVAVVSAPHLSAEQINQRDQRQERQLSPEQKAKLADYVVQNNGTLEELRQQAQKLFDQLV